MVNVEGRGLSRSVVALLIKIYGALFLLATFGTVISIVYANDLLKNSVHVDGHVISTVSDSKGRRAPVVQFKTAEGQTLQLKSDLYTSPALKVGDAVRVVYRKSDPLDWRIDDWIHLYFWTLMGAIFMFAWALAITITLLIGHFQTRKYPSTG